jgi:hypothetical protein
MPQPSQLRRRPTISLIAMTLLGLLWCGFFSSFQGETPWEANDKGWFAGWIFYFGLMAVVLVYLWWKRVRGWVIVITPLVGTFLTLFAAASGSFPGGNPDESDTSTFIDGFWPILVLALMAAGIAAGIGAVVLAVRTEPPPTEPAAGAPASSEAPR